ncbi:hypothetical protein SY88_20030 [Clostridiales bacterium PH28_bin88]|nr:hypothetical protein SY88_20030 [Clostridiales bacterium PH28_bin88]
MPRLNRDDLGVSLMLLVVCVIWGTTFVVMKVGITYIPPLLFAASRFLVGGLLMLPLLKHFGIPFPAQRDLGALMLLGILQCTLSFGMVFVAMRFVPAGTTSVILYIYPLITNVFAHFFLPGEQLNKRKMVGLGTGMAGLLLVIEHQAREGMQEGSIAGISMILVGALSWSVASILVRKRFPAHSSLQLTAFQMIFGSLFLFFAAYLWERHIPIYMNITAISLWLYSTVLASMLAFALWFSALNRWGAGRASIFMFLVPIVGVLSATIFLAEPVSWQLMAALACVAIGIITVSISPSGAGAFTIHNH